ncbi:MAG: putative Ig domain-containing protein, partial [Planctomycetota bacterium]
GVWAELDHPIFNLAFDGDGRLWATTGGGPLLELDPFDGSILAEHGEGLTMGLAIDPVNGDVIAGSRYGVERFDPVTQTFERLSRDLNVRVGSLAFSDAGELYAVQWPERDAVIKFNPLGRAENVLSFDTPIDSIAFGQAETALEGLLFVTHNTGDTGFGQTVNTGENSELTMVDLATLRRVPVASGGTRGDVVTTTSEGKVLVSQSEQVDLISPIAIPEIVATNPAEQTVVALPLGLVSVTFSEDMFTGLGTEVNSVLNPGNYVVRGDSGLPDDQQPVVTGVRYHEPSRTAFLFVEGFSAGEHTLYIGKGIESIGGFSLPAGYEVHFTTISEFSANVDITLSGTRFDRETQAISYEVEIANVGDYDLLLPMSLVLNPSDGDITSAGSVPGETAVPIADDRWLFSLEANVPDGVRLRPGESTTAKTVRLLAPNNSSADFIPGFLATASPNLRPGFDSNPVRFTAAGSDYEYDADATDPDGVAVAYLLHRGPEGMTVDPDTGIVQWAVPNEVAEVHDVVLYAFDSRGGFTSQAWTLTVSGGNQAPEFIRPPDEAFMTENENLELFVEVRDDDLEPLQVWVENLPPGAFFDPATRMVHWTPGEQAAGIYRDITFVATDGIHTVTHAFDLLVGDADRPPIIDAAPDFTLRQGNEWTYRISASDPDGDQLLFTSDSLPEGATLDSRDGTLRWLVGFDIEGMQAIPFTVSANGESVDGEVMVDILNANGAPNFDSMRGWSVEEGQQLTIRSFALDPDNPDFVLPNRLQDGTLDPPGLVSPVTYSATGLPDGAVFDAETATFTWTPTYAQSGDYSVLFEAIDDGDGTGNPVTISSRVPISVRNVNQRPLIDPVSNFTLGRGSMLDIPVSVTDPDGDNITLEAANGLPGLPLPEFVTFTDNGNGTGVFHLAPGIGDRGDYTLSLIARDDGNGFGRGRIETTQYDFVVTVESSNDPPVLQPVSSVVVLAGALLRLPLRTTDIDQEPLTYSFSGLPAEARIVDAVLYGEALLNWDPTAADIGTYNVTVTVTDEGNGDATLIESSSQSFVVHVRDNNITPVLTVPASESVDEGSSLRIQFTATDADGDEVRFESDDLPSGASLDPLTGQFDWTPSFDQAGSQTFHVMAGDGTAADIEPFTITVNPVNRSPILAFPSPQFAREGVFTEFRVTGGDFDGGVLDLVVSDLPDGALFDPSTGRFRWQPRFDQAGTYNVTFTLTDTEGLSDTITVPIVVENVNRAPQIESRHHQVLVGKLLDFAVAATDPDVDDTLTFAAYGLPEGAVIDAETGRITWIPNPGQLGQYIVDVRAKDGLAETKHNLVIEAVASGRVPDVRIITTPSFPAQPGQDVRVQVIADGFSPIDSISLTLDGVPLALDQHGVATVVAGAPGKQTLIATATDVDGFVGETTERLRVRDAADREPPELLLSLSGIKTLTDPVDVIANVVDINLDDWTLAVATRGSLDYTTIATGETTGEDLVLSTLDPRSLANGFYTMRLTARDIAGRQSQTTIDFEVNSAAKVAAYARTDIDATLDVGGKQLVIARQYDSLQQNVRGLLGDGWRFSFGETRLQFGIEPQDRGSSLDPVELEAIGVYSAVSLGDRVYLDLPDGTRGGFTFDPVPVQPFLQNETLVFYQPRWIADDGV